MFKVFYYLIFFLRSFINNIPNGKIMKVIITGGAGFIGSHIADRFHEDGFKVKIIDDLSTGKRENCKKYEFVKCSITDLKKLMKEFKGADYVIHNAAKIFVTESMKKPLLYKKINEQGTFNVLKAAKENNVKKVIFASSAAVYGSTKPPLKENSKLNPLSVYAQNKIRGEKICRNFKGVETVSLRYFNVFGPRQNVKSAYAAVIPIFISSFNGKKPVTIYGDGKQTRDFIYVKNVAEANLMAAKSEKANGKVLNIASGKPMTILELARKISPKIKIVHKQYRKGDIRNSAADASFSKKILGNYEKYSFEKGLRETILFYSNLVLNK